MKTLHYLTAALFLSTLTLAPSAAAQGTQPGSVSNIIITLKLTEALPAVFARQTNGDFALDENDEKFLETYTNYSTVKDGVQTDVEEFGRKLKVMKYGNKELLEDLLEAGGYFPDGETSIKGWSLKRVVGQQTVETYLVKKDVTPIWVTDYVEVNLLGGLVTGKRVTKATGPEEGEYESASITGSLKSLGPISLFVSVPSVIQVGVQGLATATIKSVIPPFADLPVGEGLPPVVDLVSMKGSGLFGSGTTSDSSFLAQGSVSLSSPVLVEDVFAYPDFEQ